MLVSRVLLWGMKKRKMEIFSEMIERLSHVWVFRYIGGSPHLFYGLILLSLLLLIVLLSLGRTPRPRTEPYDPDPETKRQAARAGRTTFSGVKRASRSHLGREGARGDMCRYVGVKTYFAVAFLTAV